MSAQSLPISERQFRQFVENVSDHAIILLDPVGRIMSWNDGAKQLKGYDEAEIIGQPLERLYPQAAREAGLPAQLLARAAAEGQCKDQGWRLRKDGTRFFADVTITALRDDDNTVIGFAKITRDISKQRQAEDALRASEERFRLLLNGIKDYALIMLDKDGGIAHWNDGAGQLYGHDCGDVVGHPFKLLFSAEARASGAPMRLLERASGNNHASELCYLVRQDGTQFLAEVGVTAIRNRSGDLTGFAQIAANKTETQATEVALRASEEQLRRAEHIAGIGSAWWAVGSATINWSDGLYRIYGTSRDTFVPSTDNIVAMIHPDDLEEFKENRAMTARSICPEPSEYRIIRLDGSIRRLYREFAPVFGETGNIRAFVASVQDITERRQTEEQLRQAQKMEAIGNLTGGMAHDFNNLLGIVIANLDLLRELKGDDPDVAEFSKEALDASLRGAELTRRLLAFARQQPLQPRRVDVNELATGITKLLARTVGEDIEISLDLSPNLYSTIVDPAQLEASLVNLANNSRDAMPNGGKLLVKTANRHLDADYAVEQMEVTPGDYVEIEVRDTGTGMPPEVKQRIFEPFFTTKEQGKGTGLGLAMVFGFMKQSGGHINVYSEVGLGTAFRLYLPRSKEDAAAAAAAKAAETVLGGTETILVVEDNPSLRRIATRQLSSLGYHVIEAEDAKAALAALQTDGPDLMLTDIVMPGGMNGVQLAQQATGLRPRLKVIFTSGFSAPEVNGSAWSIPETARLVTKPYRRDELAKVIRDVLDL